MDFSFKTLKQIFKRRKEKGDTMPNDVPEIQTSELHPPIVCDLSTDHSILLNLFRKIIYWRRSKFYREVEFQWSDLHLAIVRDYFFTVCETCDFKEPPCAKLLHDSLPDVWYPSTTIHAKIAASFTQELQEFFLVPRLKKNFYQSENSMNEKYQLVEAFLSFLLQLLHHKTDSIIYLCRDGIENLEKELRLFLSIPAVISWILCDDDEHEEFQRLLAKFEEVANEAGILVHSIFFSAGPILGKIDEGIGSVLNHIDLFKVDIRKFLNPLSSLSESTYITPKTSVVDSLLIIDSLIYYLEDLMSGDDNQPIVHEVKDQINILHQRLLVLQFYIKDLGSPRSSEIGELKEPLMRIGDMAYQAEYMIISFMVGDAPLGYLISRLTDINHKIELKGIELQQITAKYKFGGSKVAMCFSAQLPSQAKRVSKVDDVIVGFEERATDMLDKLVGGGGTEGLQVISIFGMAGLGKTTLAKKLYNHPSVHYWFDKRSWCVISQMYQKQSILADILIHINSELDKDKISKMEEESLVEDIYKNLKRRRYLIVMDDIWDSNVWDDFCRCFPDDGNGSRILFTSRNKDIGPPNSIIYALPALSNDQCWELLENKVFDTETCPPELLGIGKKIAANCYGLPLAVVVIAGILSTMDKEKSGWEKVRGNLASYIFEGGDNSVTQILELSYNYLPERLKSCFLYFGAFQKEKEIRTGKLMRLWIAEGFIQKEEEKSAENVAEEYLMELIDKSLVMVAKIRSDGGVKACVIHDLLRDLCFKKSGEENFLKFVRNDIYSIYEKGHRLQELPGYGVASICCQHVRSFRGGNLASPFYVRDMRLLRVLHF